MKRRCAVVGVLAAMGLAGPLFASDWTPEINSLPDASLSMDRARYERQGEAVTAWIRVRFPQARTLPFSSKAYDLSERLYFFQCAQRQMMMARNTLYGDDTVVYQFDLQNAGPLGGSEFTPQRVPTDGIEAEAFQLACDFKPEGKPRK